MSSAQMSRNHSVGVVFSYFKNLTRALFWSYSSIKWKYWNDGLVPKLLCLISHTCQVLLAASLKRSSQNVLLIADSFCHCIIVLNTGEWIVFCSIIMGVAGITKGETRMLNPQNMLISCAQILQLDKVLILAISKLHEKHLGYRWDLLRTGPV